MASVSIRGVEKRFGSTDVLRRIDLDINHGEFLTLVGPSGCGKSTLLRILAGLEYADEGQILMDGKGVDALAPKLRDIAMVFQSYALYPYMTVAENIALPLVMRRLSRWQRLPLIGRLIPGTRSASAGIARDVRAIADSLDIAHLLGRKPSQLSGGQRQRVALGRAMVRQPTVFLMDEPLSNLDAKLRVQMRSEIAELHRRLKATFVYVTHDQAEAMTMSDRVAVMLRGELLQVAPPAEIYNDPATIEVAEFIGSPRINILPAATLRDQTIDVCGLRLPVAMACAQGQQLRAGFRPEALRVTGSASPATWPTRVLYREELGADVYLHVALDMAGAPNQRIVVRATPADAVGFQPGAACAVRPDAGAALLFDIEGLRIRTRSPEHRRAMGMRELSHG